MRNLYVASLGFLITGSLFIFPSFAEKRYYGGVNFHILTSDKILDEKRKMVEVPLEYIEKRVELEFLFHIAYGFRMGFLVPLVGREVDYPVLRYFAAGNEIEVVGSLSDMNAWGLGDINFRLDWSYRWMDLCGGILFDFKLPTGETRLESGRVPLGTGQGDVGFNLFAGYEFKGLFRFSASIGYILRLYGEPSYILYFPMERIMGRGIDPGDEIKLRFDMGVKKGIFGGGLFFEYTTAKGDGVKFLYVEDSVLKEAWGYYNSSSLICLKPYILVDTDQGILIKFEIPFPAGGKNYPSEPAFPFLRNSPWYPSTGFSASIGYKF